MGAYRIEIAQPCNPPAAVAVLDWLRVAAAARQISKRSFHGILAGSVGIDRLDQCGFWNQHLIRVALKGGAASKHKGAAAVYIHRSELSLRPNIVHVPVAQDLLHRFAYSLKSTEMNHSFNWLPKHFGACEQLIQTPDIPDVYLH